MKHKNKREIETVKENNEYKKLLVHPSSLNNTEPSSLESMKDPEAFHPHDWCTDFLFRSSLFLCLYSACSSIKVISRGDIEPNKVHREGIFILGSVEDK